MIKQPRVRQHTERQWNFRKGLFGVKRDLPYHPHEHCTHPRILFVIFNLDDHFSLFGSSSTVSQLFFLYRGRFAFLVNLPVLFVMDMPNLCTLHRYVMYSYLK